MSKLKLTRIIAAIIMTTFIPARVGTAYALRQPAILESKGAKALGDLLLEPVVFASSTGAAHSELLTSVFEVGQSLNRQMESAANREEVLDLKDDHIIQLEKNGNVCSDWKKVKVSKNFDPSRVRNCIFEGVVVLGSFTEKVTLSSGIAIDSGLYNSRIVDCHIGNNVLISDVRLLANYVVKDNAILLNNGTISCSKEATFGNGVEIAVGPETGGREVKLYADITIEEAAKIASSRDNKDLLVGYDKKIKDFVGKAASDFGIIEEGVIITNTPKIENSFIGPYALIDNALMIKNTTILSNEQEKTEISDGAYVKNSIIQWGCEVTSGAIVDSSCLTEHSHVERHGKVTQSILGPNTGVAEGEVTASLVGPFVGFHHQSMLIGVLWPEGKGNVG